MTEYHVNEITVQVLTNQPLGDKALLDLYVLAALCDTGTGSGHVTRTVINREAGEAEVRQLLAVHGTDPDFLIPPAGRAGG